MISIQRKIWTLISIVLIIMALIWTMLTFYNQRMQDQYNDTLQRYLRLNEVKNASQHMIALLNNYLLTPNEANLYVLNESKEELRKVRMDIVGLRNIDNDFTITGYMNLVDSLLETTDRSLLFQSEKDTEDSELAFSEATRISRYISEMTLTLIDNDLKTYDQFYRGIIEQSEELKKLGISLLLAVTLLMLVVSYAFSRSITQPIKKLTQAARELARGRMDLTVEVKSNDEVSFLAKMFERMRLSINDLISEIQHKAQLEHELQRNKMLLQESQLRSLQSQINPHFLFNTLDTLSKKAYLEGSEETSDLIASVAGLLRYNLKRLDRSVALYEEVKVLQQYIEIQKTRFTDRLRFVTDIDESCLHVQIPGLTLQPIVENALIHAIEPMEDGGTIIFRIADVGDNVKVEIEDDGPGISEQLIEQILTEQAVETAGHSTGIGITNVVKRLRLFYGIEDVIDIESTQGRTKVILTIPKIRRFQGDDKDLDRG